MSIKEDYKKSLRYHTAVATITYYRETRNIIESEPIVWKKYMYRNRSR